VVESLMKDQGIGLEEALLLFHNSETFPHFFAQFHIFANFVVRNIYFIDSSPMKAIHTSDWHLGHLLYNFPRSTEQQDMLRQMTEVVGSERPDVLLIAGDVFDTIQPSAAVQTLLADALAAIHRASPETVILCIAGNHDSGSKHMIFHTPWLALNVHMVGNISVDSPLDDYIFAIPGKGFVVAVPFAADRYMPDDVFRRLLQRVEERNEEGLPVFLMAHLAMAHCDARGHEAYGDGLIGGLNCQELEALGQGYDYVALGHIHRLQSMDAEGRVRYCGTPLPVSFDEVDRDNRHGVLVVDSCRHGDVPSVRHLPFRNLRPLVNIPPQGFTSWPEAKTALQAYIDEGRSSYLLPEEPGSYVRLNVEVEDRLPAGAADEAIRLTADTSCRLCLINSRRKPKADDDASARSFSPSELEQLDVMEVARMAIEDRGEIFDEEMREVLKAVRMDLEGEK
jgi:exonuclease SbcD